MTTKQALRGIVSTAADGGIDLTALRLRRGFSGKNVAERLGVTPQAYAGFEKGCKAGSLSLGRLLKILDILGCDIEIRGPTASAAIVRARAPQVEPWQMYEHYAALPADFDTAHTLEDWGKNGEFTDPLPTPAIVENIRRGWTWAFRKPPPAEMLLTVPYACQLHKKMFGGVFPNAGVVQPQWQFPGGSECKATSRLRGALNAAADGIGAGRPLDDIAIELHHTLAADRAFARGSAAHARAMADLLLDRSGGFAFTWGVSLRADASERIERYRSGFRCRHSAAQLAKEALAFARI